MWSIGDSHTISLSAMAANGQCSETHRAQNMEMVIIDFEHDDLETPINGKSKALITLHQKSCLWNGTSSRGSFDSERGYMNNPQKVGGWDVCARRNWCNTTYYDALPGSIKSVVKPIVHTSCSDQSKTLVTSVDKVFLPSISEIFSDSGGFNDGYIYPYYNTATNRYKLPKFESSSNSQYWFLRSYAADYTQGLFCFVHQSGSRSGGDVAGDFNPRAGIAPAFCL